MCLCGLAGIKITGEPLTVKTEILYNFVYVTLPLLEGQIREMVPQICLKNAPFSEREYVD